MIPTIIIVALAFAWLLHETDFLRIRLESTEYQKSKAIESKSEGIKDLTNDNVSSESDKTPYKPTVFIPLEMPELTGTLNIMCKREIIQ